ncbi:MAG: hypothetical protein ABI693_03955 [Bryobacteraceae bacterium]
MKRRTGWEMGAASLFLISLFGSGIWLPQIMDTVRWLVLTHFTGAEKRQL